MKRSLQEVIELVVFGLIALLIGTGILWLLGWLLGLVSVVFTFIAGLIWALLRFIIPIAIVAGVLFFLYKMFTREKPAPVVSSTPVSYSAPVTTLESTPNHTSENPSSPVAEISGGSTEANHNNETKYSDENKN